MQREGRSRGPWHRWICVDSLTMMTQIGAIPARHPVSMWLAGYRIWLAACLGALAGTALVLLPIVLP